MKAPDVLSLTEEVLSRADNAPDPRMKQIMKGLIGHLHAFAREARLTEAEWMTGIHFLTAVGRHSTGARQEGILLSDVLGLSQLLVVLNFSQADSRTRQTVLGPFYVEEPPSAPAHGHSLARSPVGAPLHVKLKIVSDLGVPLAGAEVDVWHADQKGQYDVQAEGWDPAQSDRRARFTTDESGELSFWTDHPCSYPIPMDGPVGDLVRAMRGSAMRPAHIHCKAVKDGYEPLVTHIFIEGDPYLEVDAVFAVDRSCVANVEHRNGGAGAGRARTERPICASRARDHFGAGTGGLMHYVIIGVDHPNTADVRNQTRAKHLEYLHRAHKDVRVKLAGPLLARDRESMTGSLLVVEADSEEAVERFAAGDPYRKVGLFAELTIRHWRWTVGNPGVASSEAT